MPIRCRNVPARTEEGRRRRVWNARSAARVVCRALELGATASEMREELSSCLECSEDRRRRQQNVQALAAFAQANDAMELADGLIGAIELVVRVVSRVSRFVPQARPLGLALIPIERAFGPVRASLRASRAANDAAAVALRRAA